MRSSKRSVYATSLTGLSLAALAVGTACGPGKGNGGTGSSTGDGGGSASSAALYLIDSTGALISFDAQGNKLASVALPTPVGDLNGGGIALASGNLYVTIGQPTNSVVSFTPALAPSALPAGSFAGLDAPRGIAYDTVSSLFFVGNGAASVTAYDPNGTAAQEGLFPFHYGPSGVAYDVDDDLVWVANYVGVPVSGAPQFGVQDYGYNGTASDQWDYTKSFVAPAHTQPYAITVCPKAATGGQTTIVVGFIDDGSGQGENSVYAFSRSGALLGGTVDTFVTPPHHINALSCTPHGNVFVADDTGLWEWPGPGGLPAASDNVTAYTAPVYGVFAGPDQGGGGTGGGLDGGVGATGDGGAEGGGEAGNGAEGGSSGSGSSSGGSNDGTCVTGQPFEEGSSCDSFDCGTCQIYNCTELNGGIYCAVNSAGIVTGSCNDTTSCYRTLGCPGCD